MNTFSISQALSIGWKLTKQHFGLWVVILLTLLASNVVFEIPSYSNELFQIPGYSGETNPSILIVLNILSSLLQLILELGIVGIVLKMLDTQPVKYADLFSFYPQLGQMLIASFISVIAVVVGFIFLIIPGIYIALRLSQAAYLIVDHKLSGIEAIKTSWRITRGYTLQLLWLSLLLVIINVLGAIAVLVGLLVTIPISLIAMGYAYRIMAAHSATTTPTPVTTPQPQSGPSPA